MRLAAARGAWFRHPCVTRGVRRLSRRQQLRAFLGREHLLTSEAEQWGGPGRANKTTPDVARSFSGKIAKEGKNFSATRGEVQFMARPGRESGTVHGRSCQINGRRADSHLYEDGVDFTRLMPEAPCVPPNRFSAGSLVADALQS